MTKQLVLGGARSGKSRYAERLVNRAKQKVYVATAEALDVEMENRIAQHRIDRGDGWQLVEEPRRLAHVLRQYNNKEYSVLVDCLTLWISNCLHADCWDAQSGELLALIPELECELVMVSNEVGSGIVPLGELSREFVDASGRLNQQLAALFDRVILVVAGLPMTLKGGDIEGTCL
ncbi:MAG: bifunctional adenosylcobinamide kinase/adenosylcobinamide-phosphate guanylyltransferase [Pseudomonadota bacterium]